MLITLCVHCSTRLAISLMNLVSPFFINPAAADKYGLSRLRSMCESSLEKTFAVDTIAHTLVLSHLHSAKGLKVRCSSLVRFCFSTSWLFTDIFPMFMPSAHLLLAVFFWRLAAVASLPPLDTFKFQSNSRIRSLKHLLFFFF